MGQARVGRRIPAEHRLLGIDRRTLPFAAVADGEVVPVAAGARSVVGMGDGCGDGGAAGTCAALALGSGGGWGVGAVVGMRRTQPGCSRSGSERNRPSAWVMPLLRLAIPG